MFFFPTTSTLSS